MDAQPPTDEVVLISSCYAFHAAYSNSKVCLHACECSPGND